MHVVLQEESNGEEQFTVIFRSKMKNTNFSNTGYAQRMITFRLRKFRYIRLRTFIQHLRGGS